MAKFITEVLQELNDNIENVGAYSTNNHLKEILKNALIPSLKWILPEGVPPFKKEVAPQGLVPSNIYMEVRRFYVFRRADLTPVKREGLFISMLEGVHPSEAEILCLIKDQTLHHKYPRITKESVSQLLV